MADRSPRDVEGSHSRHSTETFGRFGGFDKGETGSGRGTGVIDIPSVKTPENRPAESTAGEVETKVL